MTDTTFAKGRAAEALAAAHLAGAGYTVVEQNARVGRLEIDIVAKHGDVLVFVEVRSRETRDAAAFSVTPKKQYEVARAAARYLAERHKPPLPMCRFDVVIVSEGGVCELIANAFSAPGTRT
jgi:putative endonuclease